MRERLPDIKIKSDVAPCEFLTRLRNLGVQPDGWRIGQFNESDEGKHLAMSLEYTGTKKGTPTTLTAWLLYNTEYDKDRVRVEMKSRNWNATYDMYVAAAYLLKPFLRLYNRTHGAKVRLIIESREQLEPKLTPKTHDLFDRFITHANRGALHSYDWQRFYDFMRMAHRLRLRLHEEDIAYLLVRKGFDEELARHIASIYEHGRGILRWPQDPTALREHRVWVREMISRGRHV